MRCTRYRTLSCVSIKNTFRNKASSLRFHCRNARQRLGGGTEGSLCEISQSQLLAIDSIAAPRCLAHFVASQFDLDVASFFEVMTSSSPRSSMKMVGSFTEGLTSDVPL